MKIDKKSLSDSPLELSVHVSRADAQKYLEQAAAHLSEHRPIKGFRPGKAPYEIARKQFGDAAIMEEALEDIINGTFQEIMAAERINTYGQIKFELLPVLAPDEIAAYKATMTLMPTVELGKWQDKKIVRNPVKVTDEELDKAIAEFRDLDSTEQPADRPAQNGDKVIIDFEVFVDGKLIEGGKADGFALVLGEGRMIPGFEEKIIGHKPGDDIEFVQAFPKDYQADHLSGKDAQFKIKLHQVIARLKPEINDDLAKKVGMTSVADLKAKLYENIAREKQDREEDRVEIAAIKQLTDSAKFSTLPEEMIADGQQDLVHDFEHTLAHRGMKFDQYLKSVNKTVDQIKEEFRPKAIERIKSSLALGKLAEVEKLEITPAEIEEELTALRKLHANEPAAMRDINQPEYRRHVANSVMNRKLIKFLKDKIVE